MGYLVDKYGKDDSLYPREPYKRALVNRILVYNSLLHEKFKYYAVSVLLRNKKLFVAHRITIRNGVRLFKAH